MFWKHKKTTLNCSLLFFLLLPSPAICSCFYKAPPVLRLIPIPHPRLGQVARGRSSNGRIWSSSVLAQKTEIWVETKKPETDEAQFIGVWEFTRNTSVIIFFFALYTCFALSLIFLWGVEFLVLFCQFFCFCCFGPDIWGFILCCEVTKNGADSNMEDLQHNPSSRKYFAQ